MLNKVFFPVPPQTFGPDLTEQQKEIFEKFKDCQSELAGLTERDAFRDGFIIAVRIMVEAMEGLETVDDI